MTKTVFPVLHNAIETPRIQVPVRNAQPLTGKALRAFQAERDEQRRRNNKDAIAQTKRNQQYLDLATIRETVAAVTGRENVTRNDAIATYARLAELPSTTTLTATIPTLDKYGHKLGTKETEHAWKKPVMATRLAELYARFATAYARGFSKRIGKHSEPLTFVRSFVATNGETLEVPVTTTQGITIEMHGNGPRTKGVSGKCKTAAIGASAPYSLEVTKQSQDAWIMKLERIRQSLKLYRVPIGVVVRDNRADMGLDIVSVLSAPRLVVNPAIPVESRYSRPMLADSQQGSYADCGEIYDTSRTMKPLTRQDTADSATRRKIAPKLVKDTHGCYELRNMPHNWYLTHEGDVSRMVPGLSDHDGRRRTKSPDAINWGFKPHTHDEQPSRPNRGRLVSIHNDLEVIYPGGIPLTVTRA